MEGKGYDTNEIKVVETWDSKAVPQKEFYSRWVYNPPAGEDVVWRWRYGESPPPLIK